VNDQQERMARTESLFRDVNERIAESAERFEAPSTEFVCECSDQNCTERVEATLDEYEHVRADATRFLVRPGHEDSRVERVVERRGRRHAVVEKFNGAVALIVRRLNPRAQQA
jgi:hypothetical protein